MKTLTKRLDLKKITVVNLNAKELNALKGGATRDTVCIRTNCCKSVNWTACEC